MRMLILLTDLLSSHCMYIIIKGAKCEFDLDVIHCID